MSIYETLARIERMPEISAQEIIHKNLVREAHRGHNQFSHAVAREMEEQARTCVIALEAKGFLQKSESPSREGMYDILARELYESVVFSGKNFPAWEELNEPRKNSYMDTVARLVQALFVQGYFIVPATLSDEVLENVGAIEGYDGPEADAAHRRWYKTLLEVML